MTPEMRKYAGTVYATILYFVVYYAYIIIQVPVKVRVVKETRDKLKKDGVDGGRPVRMDNVRRHELTRDHPDLRRADRSQLNQLEQMGPFLCSLWMYAVFVDAASAATLGYVYVAFRAMYYLVYGGKFLLVSTVPNYTIISYFLYKTWSSFQQQ